ncbi:MAG: type VI secretion system-associated FHA domain protein TagH, partial [Proteobacteria bacterium]|nr:type VI secretion system-associated FHA domain protein TagH [Pseudomonadota bacterium]
PAAAAPPAPAAPPSRPAPPPAAGPAVDYGALLAAAGIEGASASPELVENFGRILRVVVVGIMDLLRAREKIKDEFRMKMTTFKSADNNPLKFSVNVEDALHNLFVKRNPAYLAPVEAFEDAFQDARNHQVAMLAGLRVAFEAMLAEFEPEHLRENFDRQLKKGSILSGPARLKYWELYTERYQELVKDADTAFRDLFGEEFAKAYEEQMTRLKNTARNTGRS